MHELNDKLHCTYHLVTFIYSHHYLVGEVSWFNYKDNQLMYYQYLTSTSL